MNENKRLIMIFAVVAVVVGAILLISFWPEKDRTFICGVKADDTCEKLGKVDYKKYQCLVKSEDKRPLVVAEKLSKKEKEALNEAAKRANHAIYYLDTENIASSDLKNIKKELKYSNNSFKESVILVVQEKEVTEYKEGNLNDADLIYEFLKEAGLAMYICGVTVDPDNENLGTITYEQYRCLYDSDETFALMVSQTTCGYCNSFKPIIAKYSEENDVPVYVLEVNMLEGNEKTGFLSSLDYFNDNNNWGTPLTLGIRNGKVIDYIGGFTEDESVIDNFFKEIGLK